MDDGYKLTFKKGKWKMEKWMGEHPVFEHDVKIKGIISSKKSKIKKVNKE